MNSTGDPVRIAMWSGPRNISTAMMRAWETRTDTTVSDEPFYGYYLERTGADHPGRDEIIASMATDWRQIVREITGPVPGGRTVWYQKHMTHHILPEVEKDWLHHLRNCFLIRDPHEVVVSYERVRPNATAEDLGYPQQAEIFAAVRRELDPVPPVLDSADVLADPERCLTALCGALGLPFSADMLSWPPGPRSTDGVWSRHWYANVEASTGFGSGRSTKPDLSRAQTELAAACMPHYEVLRECRIGIN